MKNEKKLSIIFSIFLIMTIFFIFGSSTASAKDEPICGSIEKFNQTHRWQDLPGCTEKRDYENPTSAVTLLGRAKDAFKSFFETWDAGDFDHVNSYAGGCLGYMNNGDEYWNSNPELVKAKPAYEEMKKKVQQYLDWLPLVQDLTQRYIYAKIWLKESNDGEMESADLAVSEAKDLQKTIAKVQKQNLPDDFLIQGSGEIPAATVGEIKAKLASYLKQASNSKENAVAIDNAKWEPYTKLLSGDRLKFFNETYRIGTNVYGVGGKYLDKPEQFDTANVMCTKTWGHSGIVETWRVSCYSFRGDRQVAGPRTKSGYGNNTPSSAYR
jgi:hypothetical protein